LRKVGLKTVQRLDADLHAFLLRMLRDRLKVLHDEVELLLLLRIIVRPDEADDGVDRADDARAAELRGLVDEAGDVILCGLLVLRAAAEVAAGSHAGADAADRQSVLLRSSADLRRIDMLERLHGDFDRFEAPVLELREKLHALGREWAGVEKGIDAETHGRAGLGRGLLLRRKKGRAFAGIRVVESSRGVPARA
jgi:hypothetical protein